MGALDRTFDANLGRISAHNHLSGKAAQVMCQLR